MVREVRLEPEVREALIVNMTAKLEAQAVASAGVPLTLNEYAAIRYNVCRYVDSTQDVWIMRREGLRR